MSDVERVVWTMAMVGIGLLTILVIGWGALYVVPARRAACEAEGMTAISIGRGINNACADRQGVIHMVPEAP